MEFAIVVSQFNKSITDKLLQGALSRLIELSIDEKMVKIIRVPGAIEIPLAAKLLAEAKNTKPLSVWALLFVEKQITMIMFVSK